MINKLLSAIIFLALIVVVFIYFVSNVILAHELEKRLGVPVKVKSLRVNPLEKTITAREIKVLNPEQFSERTLADIEKVEVHYDLSQFKEKILILDLIKINVQKVTFEKNKNGEINFELLKSFRNSSEVNNSRPDVQVVMNDIFYSINEFRYVNAASITPISHSVNLNIVDRRLTSAPSIVELARIILVDALKKSTHAISLPEITSFLGAWSDTAKDLAQIAGEALGGLLNKLTGK